MRTKNKRMASIVALVLVAAMALTGTFAWQSISQTAKNEAMATLNPGGRLHDDFDGTNKDIYVENFTTDGAPIFARVRLAEYMEIGEDAGKPTSATKRAESLVAGAQFDDEKTWTTHIPGEKTFSQYWDWATGGSTIYMPTFNKNQDSLKADINGTYAGKADTDKHYDDYIKYELDMSKTDNAQYDIDDNDIDEGDDAVEGTNFKYVNETHKTQSTIEGKVMTMAAWLELPDDQKTGDFWVWDEDGWAYWANPIKSQTATGLLLDGITLKGTMMNSWYYGIYVEGQFCTADDLGWKDKSGFYAPDTKAPSDNAEKLLEAMGIAPNGNKITVTAKAADDAATVAQGGSRQFLSTVIKGTEPLADATVTWTVSGADGCTIDDKGVLTVPEGVAADTKLTITATYTDEEGNETSGSATITVRARGEYDDIVDKIAAIEPGSADTFTASYTKNDEEKQREFYVLAKDEENNRALIMPKLPIQVLDDFGPQVGITDKGVSNDWASCGIRL